MIKYYIIQKSFGLKIYPSYVSKQVIPLMIPNRKKHEAKFERCNVNSNYIPLKSLSILLRGVASKYYGEFYCLNCYHSFRTKNKFKSLKEHVKVKISGI